jgi:hypothetical protein
MPSDATTCGEATGLGCGDAIALAPDPMSGDLAGYRCVECDTAFCKPCIREHFKRTTVDNSQRALVIVESYAEESAIGPLKEALRKVLSMARMALRHD